MKLIVEYKPERNDYWHKVTWAGPKNSFYDNSPQIKEWIAETYNPELVHISGSAWSFRNQADATMFVLKWGK